MDRTVYVGRHRNLGSEEGFMGVDPDKDWILYGHAVGEKGKEQLETYFGQVKDAWEHIGCKFEFEIKEESDQDTIDKVLAMHDANPGIQKPDS
jgi:hypothetical protein